MNSFRPSSIIWHSQSNLFCKTTKFHHTDPHRIVRDCEQAPKCTHVSSDRRLPSIKYNWNPADAVPKLINHHTAGRMAGPLPARVHTTCTTVDALLLMMMSLSVISVSERDGTHEKCTQFYGRYSSLMPSTALDMVLHVVQRRPSCFTFAAQSHSPSRGWWVTQLYCCSRNQR